MVNPIRVLIPYFIHQQHIILQEAISSMPCKAFYFLKLLWYRQLAPLHIDSFCCVRLVLVIQLWYHEIHRLENLQQRLYASLVQELQQIPISFSSTNPVIYFNQPVEGIQSASVVVTINSPVATSIPVSIAFSYTWIKSRYVGRK